MACFLGTIFCLCNVRNNGPKAWVLQAAVLGFLVAVLALQKRVRYCVIRVTFHVGGNIFCNLKPTNPVLADRHLCKLRYMNLRVTMSTDRQNRNLHLMCLTSTTVYDEKRPSSPSTVQRTHLFLHHVAAHGTTYTCHVALKPTR